MAAEAPSESASAPAADASGKPRVLVLGGTGFIGRNMVKYLIDNDLASFVKVCDKSHTMTSHFAPEHTKPYEHKDKCVFVQTDLAQDAHIAKKVFDPEARFDIVINLAGETRFAMKEEDYKLRIVTPVQKVAAAAEKAKVSKWVEVSTARVYDATEKPSNEEAKVNPWTTIAKFRLQAEQELQKFKGLPVVTLRPAYVYGRGDLTSFTPRMACATHYKSAKETMEFLWGKDLKLNAVHVDDLCAAIWAAATKAKAGSLYNVCEGPNLTQGDVNGWIGKIFKIKTDFAGGMKSRLAGAVLETTAEYVNDKHVPAFTNICQQHNILNTPLSAYIDKELLKNNHLCVDGSKITRELGVQYKHQCSEKELRDVIDFFIANKQFPPVLD